MYNVNSKSQQGEYIFQIWNQQLAHDLTVSQGVGLVFF